MSGPTAPYYEDVRWPGSGGLRVPNEAAPASLAVFKELDLGVVSGTINLTPKQAGSSFITANPSAALTLVLPGCQPGFATAVQNLSASYTITVEVSGNTSNTAVIPVSTMGVVIQTGTNSGVALMAVASVAAFQASIATTVYTSAGAIAPNGTAVLNTGTAGAMSLVVPPAGATLSIVAADANAYVVTTPANAITGSKHIATFAGAVGDYIQFASSAGVWTVVSSNGVILT
jgi:hypothetical protein